MTDAAQRDGFPAVDPLPGAWQGTLLTVARVLVGGGSVILGLALGGLSVSAYATDRDVAAFSSMVVLGGVILLAQARQRPQTSRTAWIAATAVTVAGLVASVLVPVGQRCCDAAWTVAVGLPLPWTVGGGDTWAQSVGEAWSGRWDPVSAVADVIFWAYAGMVVLVVVGLARRATRHSVGARP
jgi:hypothetical protein